MITMKQLRFILAPTFLVALSMAVDLEVKIVPEQQVLEGTEGGMQVMTCTHNLEESASDVTLTWFGPDNTALSTSGNKMVEKVMPTQLQLMMYQVSKRDEGVYTCKASFNGQEEQAAIELKIKKELKFTSPAVQAVVNGTNARVWCRINQALQEGQTMRWYQRPNGTFKAIDTESGKFMPMFETSPGQEGSYLRIQNVDLADSMNYTCSLQLPQEGRAVAFNIRVIVTVPPKILPIYLSPTSPMEGEKLTMTCKADGVPDPTYMFYKGNRALMEERSHDGKFVIESLKRTDEGEYTCNAMNAGGSQNESHRLDVRIPPAFESTSNMSKNAGERLEMECTATGDPEPELFWREKDGQVDILERDNSESDMYVMKETYPPMRDGDVVLYKQTLKLVIEDLKPRHAGEYVCRADNQFGGVKTKTFRIDVQYKPNFDSQEDNLFYGWAGSTTNLTCVANGNPEPMFAWIRGDQEITKDNQDYDITQGVSGVSTRAISYLKPKVNVNNVNTMFGEYKCKAFNKFGESIQTLVFQQAVVPELVTVNVISTKATEMMLRISPPAIDGGQPVFKYVVKYGPSDKPQEPMSKNFTRYPDERSTPVTLENLTPKTSYSIRVYAVNNVGLGKEKTILESTKDYSVPDPVKVLSPREGLLGSSYELSWDVPMTGGRTISNYVIKWTRAIKVDDNGDKWKVVREEDDWKLTKADGERNTRTTLTGLAPNTYYKVKITAVNNIGASNSTEFVFKTGLGRKEIKDDGGPALGPGGIAALMIIILILVALAVDAAFYKTKQCGLIWTLCTMLGRKEEGAPSNTKSPEDGDEAATKLLAKEKDEVKTEDEVNGQNSSSKPAEEAEEVAEEKKELEPEDKEEKPAVVEVPAPAEPAKETAAPPQEEAGEKTTEVETKPAAAEEKSDKPPEA